MVTSKIIRFFFNFAFIFRVTPFKYNHVTKKFYCSFFNTIFTSIIFILQIGVLIYTIASMLSFKEFSIKMESIALFGSFSFSISFISIQMTFQLNRHKITKILNFLLQIENFMENEQRLDASISKKLNFFSIIFTCNLIAKICVLTFAPFDRWTLIILLCLIVVTEIRTTFLNVMLLLILTRLKHFSRILPLVLAQRNENEIIKKFKKYYDLCGILKKISSLFNAIFMAISIYLFSFLSSDTYDNLCKLVYYNSTTKDFLKGKLILYIFSLFNIYLSIRTFWICDQCKQEVCCVNLNLKKIDIKS